MSAKKLLRTCTEMREEILKMNGGNPSMMCFAVCAALQGYLSFFERIETDLVTGDFEIDDGQLVHVWLVMKDGEIIDPTADQLVCHGYPRLPPVYIGPVPDFYPQGVLKMA